MQLSVTARDAALDALETGIGASPHFQVIAGDIPDDCAASDAGTVLADLTLPAGWLADAASGSKALAGVWSAACTADGTAAHFRIYNAAGTVCHMQGSVSLTDDGGELQLSSLALFTGVPLTITAFTILALNL